MGRSDWGKLEPGAGKFSGGFGAIAAGSTCKTLLSFSEFSALLLCVEAGSFFALLAEWVETGAGPASFD
jgi:hypothetical protein